MIMNLQRSFSNVGYAEVTCARQGKILVFITSRVRRTRRGFPQHPPHGNGAYIRILKLARTIADLEGAKPPHCRSHRLSCARPPPLISPSPSKKDNIMANLKHYSYLLTVKNLKSMLFFHFLIIYLQNNIKRRTFSGIYNKN